MFKSFFATLTASVVAVLPETAQARSPCTCDDSAIRIRIE